MNNSQLAAEMFHADGWNDKQTNKQYGKTTSRYSQFCERT